MNPANDDPTSVPQAEQPNHHRGGSCGCLFRTFWILLVTIILLACLIVLVFWILIQPRSFIYHVSEAKLTQFNYTTNNNNDSNTLRYNLVLNFTVRNPNKKLKIYYDVVEGNAFYKGHRFSTTDVNMPWRSYLQDTKNTVRMSSVFSGQHVMILDKDEVDEFERERRAGVFDIDVKLYFTIRFRLGDFIPGDTKANAECELRVPFGNSNGTVAAVTAFQPTKCDVNY